MVNELLKMLAAPFKNIADLVSGTSTPYTRPAVSLEDALASDQERLRQDWTTVGNDMRIVLGMSPYPRHDQ